MHKTKHYAEPITFTDDVIITAQIRNVADLIKFVRDAVCHPESPNHTLVPHEIKFSFNVAWGRCHLAKIGEWEFKTDYADDVGFFYGPQRIYLKRHIVRALEEARAKLTPLL